MSRKLPINHLWNLSYNIYSDKINPNMEKTGTYNPSKMPIYLGIFTIRDETKNVSKLLYDSVDLLSTKFDKDENITELKNELSSGKIPFTPIDDLHITSFFIGKSNNRQSEYFKNFVDGLEMDIDLVGVAIVPGKIVAGISFPDQSTIKIENKCPHVTLYKGGWAPKMSNDLLEALAAGPMSSHFSNQFKTFKVGDAEKWDVQVGKEKVTAYVVRPYDLKMPSKTKGHF
jgi:hypothetical protein